MLRLILVLDNLGQFHQWRYKYEFDEDKYESYKRNGHKDG
jgi:hypothetical protein